MRKGPWGRRGTLCFLSAFTGQRVCPSVPGSGLRVPSSLPGAHGDAEPCLTHDLVADGGRPCRASGRLREGRTSRPCPGWAAGSQPRHGGGGGRHGLVESPVPRAAAESRHTRAGVWRGRTSAEPGGCLEPQPDPAALPVGAVSLQVPAVPTGFLARRDGDASESQHGCWFSMSCLSGPTAHSTGSPSGDQPSQGCGRL